MANFRRAKVESIEFEASDILLIRLTLEDGRNVAAAAFPAMLGPVQPGDQVVVNTTGLDLRLGTGGVAFVLWNLDARGATEQPDGHIMKLRYTPWQMNVLAAEEPSSTTHDVLAEATSIGGMPVVACGLHSQVAAVAAGIKAVDPALRVAYLMTDAGALPLAWSRLIRRLRASGLVDVTATSGHAFGGDLEVVNDFSGLLALRAGAGADVVIAAMGPGVVGTGTRLGFSAIEQGQLLDAASALGGRAIACLRISFADERPRHHGVSHHSLTALRVAARERCTVVVPALPPERREEVISQLVRSGIPERHEVVQGDGSDALEFLAARGITPDSMGRSVTEAPELFLSAGAAGRVAGDIAARSSET